jgi:uncharacterized membrane protein
MTAFIVVMACDALFAVLAVPLMLRKVPPNVLYGYRTRATLSNQAMWYEANAHFGRGFFIGSLISGVAALVIYSMHPADQFVPLLIVALVVPPLVAAVATARHIRRLSP